MANDFQVYYDPETEDSSLLVERMLFNLIEKRRKGNKPTNIFIDGQSGEGKSWTAIKIQMILLGFHNQDLSDHIETINMFTPDEYPDKMDKILYDKSMKKVYVITMHEARNLISSKLWNSFVSRAIGDISNQVRVVKRLISIICSQNWADITKDVRRGITYYCDVQRPIGKNVRFRMYKIVIDKYDLEKPKMRKYPISGVFVDKQGNYNRYKPKYIEITKPPKELRDLFDRLDFEKKNRIIKRKLGEILDKIKSEIGEESDKVKHMVDWYIKNPDYLNMIGKRKRGKWTVTSDLKKMHDLNKSEVKDFEDLLTQAMEEKELM